MSRRRWTWNSCTHQHSTQCAAPQEGGRYCTDKLSNTAHWLDGERQLWVEHSALIGWRGQFVEVWDTCRGIWIRTQIKVGSEAPTRILSCMSTLVSAGEGGGVFSVFSGVLVHSVPLCVPVNLDRTIGKHLGLLVDPSGSCSARRATLPRSAMTTRWEELICLWWMVLQEETLHISWLLLQNWGSDGRALDFGGEDYEELRGAR